MLATVLLPWAEGPVGLVGTPLAAQGLAENLSIQPLAPRSARPAGGTLFTRIEPAQSGVVADNRYDDPRMWGELYHEFEVGAIGTGVAIGDYDGDGRPDLFIVSKTESCRLFRNLGDWRFQDVTRAAGVEDRGAAAGVWKQGASFADVNNDGRLDLYVCRFNAPNLLYLNQGDGTFREVAQAAGVAIVDASGMAGFADYDRDGWLDFYLQTNLRDNKTRPTGQPDYLFRNNGDGTFTNVTAAAGIRGDTQGHSATWWDYDQDGWPDLYAANDFAAPDTLYRNNRDGTFSSVTEAVLPHMTYSSMGADLGDLNGDGWFDLIVGEMLPTTHEKEMRSVADPRDRMRDPIEHSIVVPQFMRNMVYVNTGAGAMLEASYLTGLAATDWTWSMRLEDLDNDGRVDLHVTNGMHREAHNADLILRQMTAESASTRVQIMRNSPVLAEANLAFRNVGDLQFENVSSAWGLDEVGVSFGAAFGDLDGDGDLDLVYTNFQRGVTLLRNDSDQGHRVVIELRDPVRNRFGVGATVRLETADGRQMRQLVLARGYLSSSEPVLHFGLGGATRILRLTVEWPDGRTESWTDLPVDRRLTITSGAGPAAAPAAAAGAATQFTEVSRTAGLLVTSREDLVDETVQQRGVPLRFNRQGPALAVGDVDGDGHDDVMIGGTPQDPVRLLLRRAPGRFSVAESTVWANTLPVNDGPLLIFEADGDGRADVLVTKGGASLPADSPEYQPQLFLGTGGGGFVRAAADALPELPVSVGAAAAADFDRDGQLDLFVGGRLRPGDYPFPARSALLHNRGGRFTDVTGALASGLENVGLVTSALWSDVDGDGWLDLLLTLDWGGVRAWRNLGGRGFEDRSSAWGFAAAGTGWWTALAAADFNGDGRMDYVAGNVGLNTPYRASPEAPAILLAGDFRGGGSAPQLIEARWDGERLLPRRSRRTLGAAIPAVLRRIPTNEAYAQATLEQIVGREKLAAAERWEATELRSGVFLSQPGGAHRFQPLPRMAQIAPIQGLVTGDFDGDGRADLYAVHNSHAPSPVLGTRFGGGLSQWLRGDGAGGFGVVPLAESGLVVPGDAKALVVLDFDGDARPDLLVSRNHATTLAFRHAAAPGAGEAGWAVRLTGAAGNPTGIGARLRLETDDGEVQTREITAGGGYLSQSSPVCFFGLRAGQKPRQLTVRWPTGTEVVYRDFPATGIVTVREP